MFQENRLVFFPPQSYFTLNPQQFLFLKQGIKISWMELCNTYHETPCQKTFTSNGICLEYLSFPLPQEFCLAQLHNNLRWKQNDIKLYQPNSVAFLVFVDWSWVSENKYFWSFLKFFLYVFILFSRPHNPLLYYPRKSFQKVSGYEQTEDKV